MTQQTTTRYTTPRYTATRYHDFCCGHRVANHENKCAHLHGHNYRAHFHCEAHVTGDSQLDDIGRVVDFSQIKNTICEWIEINWDHRMLLWEKDVEALAAFSVNASELIRDSIVLVSFNPTAENMARALLLKANELFFNRTIPIRVYRVDIDETRKCRASYEKIRFTQIVSDSTEGAQQ